MVAALLFNHHPENPFTVRAGDRIAQVVIMEKFTANFQRVTDKNCLGITKLGSDGFGSTGVSVIKKKKIKEVSSEENLLLISEKADNETQTTSEEPTSAEPTSEKTEALQITSEEAIMSVDKKVIVHESITISD